ncbi:hypothetical protein ERL59_08515 [Chengkuizengella sp. YPA3-1-1]|uniref:Integrase catalytic domain-containing protein n=1 Tax=Chengkuizengella marina TaxID=2507566 RepID=A0A6N9Q2I1_9BACL|nr:hypothetical protein [Chengkuizengella marina]
MENKWQYVCLFIDLYNREMIGYSARPNKDSLLVWQAMSSVKTRLDKITLFHTNRGNEFKNKLIDEMN